MSVCLGSNRKFCFLGLNASNTASSHSAFVVCSSTCVFVCGERQRVKKSERLQEKTKAPRELVVVLGLVSELESVGWRERKTGRAASSGGLQASRARFQL